MTPSTEKAIQAAWDLEQIRQLKARYCRFIDTGDWKGYRTLFSDNFEAIIEEGKPPFVTTGDAYVAFAEKFFAGNTGSRHQVHMEEIHLTSDHTATGVWPFYEYVEWPTRPKLDSYGYYNEEYDKGSDGKWRIRRLRIQPHSIMGR